MYPVLFTFPAWLPLLGGKSLHVYGLMIALGFLTALLWIRYESRRIGVDRERAVDLFFYAMIAGLVGSRILYVIHSVDDFWSNPLVFFRVWEGGLVFQGGVIGSLLVAFWYCRKHNLPYFKMSDVFAPALSFGHALGRVGCFFAGCCFGRQCSTDFPLALIFPHVDRAIAPPGVPLYPTQLFESFGEVIIFSFLVFFRKKKPFDGAVILLYLILYSILRSVNEVFRGDIERGFVVEPYLSNGQFISIIFVIASGSLWFYLSRRRKKA